MSESPEEGRAEPAGRRVDPANRQAEALAASNAERDRLWRSSRDILASLDAKGTFVSVSPAVTTILGWLPDEMTGRNLLDFVLPEDAALTSGALETARREALPITENRCRHKDGGFRWISWVAAPEGDLIFASGRHVTAEKEALEALTKLAADRSRILRNASDLIVVLDPGGVIRSANPASQDIIGWPPEAVIGRNVREFAHPDDEPPMRPGGDAEAAHEGVPRSFEHRWRHRDGTWRDIAWSTSCYDGLVYAYGRDVTREKEQARTLAVTEEHLRQSQKMEAVGQLTGGIAHDFNNLLTIIRTSIDLLRRPNLAEERKPRFMEAISSAVTRAAKLTGQLLAFARRQALQPVVFDAAANVAAIADMIGTLVGARVSVEVFSDGSDCAVDADPGQFDTAIVNMVVNARDAMAGAGRLTIRTRRVAGIPGIRAHAPVSGDFVAISLLDSGTGIEAERLDRIFEPFYTTKPIGQGTGLGLSQVFGFAKQSRGEIQVESALGEGTTFTLYLPSARRVAARVAVPDPGRAVQPRVEEAGRILLVEDNQEVALSVETTLLELGYQVEVTLSATDALARLAEDAERFVAVFSDVVMAGMDGIQLAREIGRRHERLPIVLSSGYSHVLSDGAAHGFPLLPKPYSVEALADSLSAAIAQRAAPPAAAPAHDAASIDARNRENIRLGALEALGVLDTAPEAIYDDLTRVAATLFDVPIAMVSLIDADRQWFKARVGVDATETPRRFAFCSRAIEAPREVTVVPDATRDPRFAGNPFVTGDPRIRFYVGAPLVTSTGQAVGTLCVVDLKPRQADPKQIEALSLLARQVIDRLERRRGAAEGAPVGRSSLRSASSEPSSD